MVRVHRGRRDKGNSLGRGGWFVAAAAVVGLASLAGCAHPTPVYYVVEAIPEEVVVPCEPPRQQLEVPPEPPSDSCVWQAGYYHWGDEAWDWMPGTWVEPRPGFVYVGPSVVFGGGAWRYRAPYWRHHRRHRSGPGHRPRGKNGVMARAPRGEGPRSTLTPHRAPPAHPAKHRAPAHEASAATPTKHRAPAHTPPGDPDRPGKRPAPDGADEPRAVSMAPVGPAQLPPRADLQTLRRRDETGRPKSIRIAPGPGSVAVTTEGMEAITDIHRNEGKFEMRSRRVDVESLRGRSEFRGTRAGRMVFGDDPDQLQPVHRVRREHDYPTDVISFLLDSDANRLEAELIVSAETAIHNATQYGWAPFDELTLYAIHGTLHLIGYLDKDPEDQATMVAAEAVHLQKLKPS